MTYIAVRRWVTVIEIYIETAVDIHKTVPVSSAADSHNYVQSYY
jgi:hypothetical protein